MNLRLALFDFDPRENGRAVLDHISENGVPPEEGRAFATWLEQQLFEKLGVALAELEELKHDYQQYVDDHPDQEAIVPQAADLYHKDKPTADRVALGWKEADKRIRGYDTQFEPYNGWVIRLYPAPCDLTAYEGKAEIADGRPRKAPQGKIKPVPLGHGPTSPASSAGKGAGGASQAAPTKGATARVWEIADAYVAEKGPVNRSEIIDRCEKAGINNSTAGTQYSKWKKARGY